MNISHRRSALKLSFLRVVFRSDRTEGANEEVKIKPAKLSRAKGPKPLLPLGRKWAKKPPPAATRTNDTPEQSAVAGEAEDQVINIYYLSQFKVF